MYIISLEIDSYFPNNYGCNNVVVVFKMGEIMGNFDFK